MPEEKLPKLRLCIVCGKLFDVEHSQQYICRKCEKKENDVEKMKGVKK